MRICEPLIAIACLVALVGCFEQSESDPGEKSLLAEASPGIVDSAGEKAVAGPPPFPVFQMRAQVPAVDRVNSAASGSALFSNRCGYCHLEAGMGTNVLTRQRVMAGFSPASGLLANRDDLSPEYIKTVGRYGKGAMPRLTKVDVTDAELALIAAYLSGEKR